MSIGIQNDESSEGGIRGILRKYPAVIIGVIAVLVIVALWYSMGAMAKQGQAAFFTNDDGKTMYSDAFTQAPPFTSGGKEISIVIAISCDGGKTLKPGWLVRYTPDQQKTVNAMLKSGNIGMMPRGQVKAPVGGEWLSNGDIPSVNSIKEFTAAQAAAKKANEITSPKCPDGSDPMIMLPE